MGRIATLVLGSFLFSFSLVGETSAQDFEDVDFLSLSPASEWSFRQYDDKCRAERSFGSGENRTTMWIDQGGKFQAFTVTLLGQPLRSPFGPQILVQFGDEGPVRRDYIKSKSSRGRPVMVMFGVTLSSGRATDAADTPGSPEPETTQAMTSADEDIDLGRAQVGSDGERALSPERLAQITDMKLLGAVIKPLKLETGPLEIPLDELKECSRELDEKLSLNTHIAATPVEPVDIAKWARVIQQNYPSHMLREEQEGRLGVRLTVNTKGRPTYCEVTFTSGPASFNDTVCLLMLKHATFEPARTSEGKPLTARYSTAVSFKLN